FSEQDLLGAQTRLLAENPAVGDDHRLTRDGGMDQVETGLGRTHTRHADELIGRRCVAIAALVGRHDQEIGPLVGGIPGVTGETPLEAYDRPQVEIAQIEDDRSRPRDHVAGNLVERRYPLEEGPGGYVLTERHRVLFAVLAHDPTV